MSGRKILVLPDSHSQPDVSNDRYEWVGKMIIDHRPDIVVDLGDFADVPSLSSYDKGRKSHEGRRLLLDIQAAVDARIKITAPLRALQARQRVNKEKLYVPRLVALGGNHEFRINRLMNDSAEFDGLYTQDISGAAQQGWEFHPFLEMVKIEGINFCHYFPSGVMGRPTGGENPAKALINKMHSSCIAGHLHLLDYAEIGNQACGRIIGVVGGCFFEHNEGFAGPANAMYRRGLSLLHDVHDGVFDFEWVGMNRIRAEYA